MWPSTPAEWRSLAIAAPRIWPSTAVTVSASAISRITWLIPTPHRLTVYASAAPLPDAPATLVIGWLARPYPSGTFPRRIALTSPSARRLRQESAGLGSGVLEHVDQFRLAGVERSVWPVGRRLAPAHVAGADFEQVAVRPASAACSVRCRRSSLMSAGTSMRRRTFGSTSLSVTLRRRTAAVMPRDYDAAVRLPSSRAGVRRDDAPDDRRCGRGHQRAKPAGRRR